jgi:AbrB family looped-hinge helix DNA binding protein
MAMERARLSTKGQLVIPVKMRKRLKLKAKEDVIIEMRDDSIVIKPRVRLSELRGIASAKGRGLVDELLKERERDLEGEEQHFKKVLKRLKQK